MKLQLITSSIYSFLFLCNFILAEQIRKHFTKFKEISRKFVHIISGLIALSFPYYIRSHWTVMALVTIFCILMLITKRKKLLKSIHDIGRESYGSFYYPLAIYLIFLLASDKPAIYFTSILVMTISDAFAALIGKKYGVIKFEVEGNTKSLEGSVSFFFISFLCVLIPLLLMTNIGKIEAILISFIISTLLTGLEAISPTGSDNIIIPFGTYFLLMKMINLPLSLIVWDVYALLIIIIATTALYILKPSGLIGIMLLNYASFTLGGFYWFLPLFLTELLLFLLITVLSPKNQIKKFPIKVLFYLGIIPTTLIFLANTLNKDIFFIPYLVSIVAQMPLSYSYNLDRSNQIKPTSTGILSLFVILLIIIPSYILYFKSFNIQLVVISLISSWLIFIINHLIHKRINIENEKKNEYRIRFVSTIIGALIAFLLSYQGVQNA